MVTGFLGAGKSALARRLRAALPGLPVIEAAAGAGALPLAATVAVADAANLGACLADPLIGPAVAAPIRTAGLVALSRTDLVPAAPALCALRSLTDAPIVEVPYGDLPDGLATRIAALPPSPSATAIPEDLALAEWRYAGPAEIPESALDALLADRPEGAYRIAGKVRCGRHGVSIEVVGRLRQTLAIPLPAETVLAVSGPRARFRPDRMAVAFSEAVAARGWLGGLFGYR